MNLPVKDYARKAARCSRILYLLLRIQQRYILQGRIEASERLLPLIKKKAGFLEKLSQSLYKNHKKFLPEVLPASTMNVIKNCIALNSGAGDFYRKEAQSARRELFIFLADQEIRRLREEEDSDG